MTDGTRAILDNTSFLLTRCSRDLRYLNVSKAFAAMLGRTPGEIVDKKIVEVIGRQAFETILPHIEAVLRGQTVEFETEIDYPGAGSRRLRVTYVPERDEQSRIVGWIGSITDITENKQITEEKEQLENIAAQMGIGIWRLDKRTNTVTWTRQIEEIYGVDASKVKSYEDFRNLIHPDDVQELEDGRDAAVDLRKSMQFEFRIVRPDGEVRWVMGVGRVIYDDGTGEPLRTIGTNIDITESKLAQAQAERQRKELAHLTRVAMLGGLSAGIAHELSQPIASILVNAQAAQVLAAKDRNWEEIKTILEDIVQEDLRAGEVISHLRKLLKKGGRQEHEAQINLNDLIHSTLKLLRSEIINNEIRIKTDLKDALPSIPGRSVELQQVLLNLMTNAIDAMAPGPASGRLLEISSGDTREGYVKVSVRDHGQGIPQDRLDTILNPFFTTKEEGLGIGLSICKTIVASHRGQLALSNASGGGAIATVLLPANANGAGSS